MYSAGARASGIFRRLCDRFHAVVRQLFSRPDAGVVRQIRQEPRRRRQRPQRPAACDVSLGPDAARARGSSPNTCTTHPHMCRNSSTAPATAGGAAPLGTMTCGASWGPLHSKNLRCTSLRKRSSCASKYATFSHVARAHRIAIKSSADAWCSFELSLPKPERSKILAVEVVWSLTGQCLSSFHLGAARI